LTKLTLLKQAKDLIVSSDILNILLYYPLEIKLAKRIDNILFVVRSFFTSVLLSHRLSFKTKIKLLIIEVITDVTNTHMFLYIALSPLQSVNSPTISLGADNHRTIIWTLTYIQTG
jgi:hypothetical protein